MATFLRLPTLSLLAALGITSLCSCSSSKESTPKPASSMSWTVDSTVRTPTDFQYFNLSSNTLQIVGTVYQQLPSDDRVVLTFPKEVGVYPFNPINPFSKIRAQYFANAPTGNGLVVYNVDIDPATGNPRGSGTITVSEATPDKVVGTFSFEGVQTPGGTSKLVSKGTFYVAL